MSADTCDWQNFSPGDLSYAFPIVSSGDVSASLDRSRKAFPDWAGLSLDARRAILTQCCENLRARSEEIAVLITRETGKPIREARLEIAAAIAKFDLTFADGERFLRDAIVADGPHPSLVRHSPRGPAAVIAPFNFPIHLGHGPTLAYLLAGNTVLFKPSPMAANVGLAYAQVMQAALPEGVFELVQGWGPIGQELCLNPAVRAVCFTGSLPVGKALSSAVASDYAKCLALELGGKNTAIICEDADLAVAADAVADGMCLTAGQRCNATSRVLLHRSIADRFLVLLQSSLMRYRPADPLDESTLLGPLIQCSAHERYERLISGSEGDWIVPGGMRTCNDKGQHGFYVLPAVIHVTDVALLDASPLARCETFAPILVVEIYDNESEAIARHEAWAFGLTASVFTDCDVTFSRIGSRLSVGNLYRNLPTTFSPSVLPFGGWGSSGNGRPGGRGFLRFAIQEQAVQWKA